MPHVVEYDIGMDGASDGKGTSSKRPAEDEQPENELARKFKHIKWKSSDLPTTQDQRAATEKLVYGFKKLGGFDSARKRTFTRFDEGEHKEAFIKAMHDLAEQELEKNPSLLAKDRRQAAPLIEGKAERANLYATAEEVVDQYIDDMFGDEAEEQLREIRRSQVGEAQATDEKERGARAQAYYDAQSAERRAQWAREWEAKQEEQRQLDIEARRKRDKEIEAKLQEELLEKQRKAKKEKEMEEYRALKARQDAEWAWEQKMLDQHNEAKRKKEELKAIEEAALRELIEEGKRAAAKSARGDTGTITPGTRKGKESALAAIMRAEKMEKEAGPPVVKAASVSGQEESPAPAPVTVEPQRKQPILKFGHAGGGTTRPPPEPSYDRGGTQDQYYQDHGYDYKHSHHSRSDYQQDHRREDKYYDDKSYSDRRYESRDYKSSSRTDRADDYYHEKDYHDKYDKYDDREKEYRDKYDAREKDYRAKYDRYDDREKEYRDKYDKYDDRYERDDKYKYDTRADDRRGTERHNEQDKYHDRDRRSSVAESRHSNEERSSRRSEHGRRDYEKDEEYYTAKDKEHTSKDKDYAHGSSRRATLSKHDSTDMPPPPPKESRRNKEHSARARSEEGEYTEPTTHSGSRDRRREDTSRSTRSPSRRDTAYESSSRRQDSPRRYRKRSRSRERDGIDRYVPSSSSSRRDDRDGRDKDRDRDRDRGSQRDKDYIEPYDSYKRNGYSRGGERDYRDYNESKRKEDRRGDYDEEKSKEYHSRKYEEDYYEDDSRHIYYEHRERLDDPRDKFDARARRGDPEAEPEFFLPNKERSTQLDGVKEDKVKDAHQDAKVEQRRKCSCRCLFTTVANPTQPLLTISQYPQLPHPPVHLLLVRKSQ